MKHWLIFTLSLLLMSGCVATKKNAGNSWIEKLNGTVQSIQETTYKSVSDADPKNPFKQVRLKNVLPRDSSVTTFTKNTRPIQSSFYCKQYDENENPRFGLCFQSESSFDNKGRLKKIQNYSLMDNDTSIFKYKAYNELQLPVFIEEVNLEGKVVKNHVLDFNKKGRLESTRIVYKQETETISETHYLFEYNRRGLVTKMTVEARDGKGRIEDEPTVYTYQYKEFDKKGNWTKRIEKYSLHEDDMFLTYRSYQYF